MYIQYFNWIKIVIILCAYLSASEFIHIKLFLYLLELQLPFTIESAAYYLVLSNMAPVFSRLCFIKKFCNAV